MFSNQSEKPNKFRFFVIGLLLAVGGNLFSATGFRKYAGEFMAIHVSPRAQALGGAFTALANDVTAGFYNPAGLAGIQTTQAAFMHTWQFVSFINYDYLGFTRPLSARKAFAVSLIRLGIDDIKDTRKAQVLNGTDWRLDPSKVKQFSASDYVLFLSLAQKMNTRFSWGFNVKFVRRNLAEHHANGLGLDAGVILNVWDRLRIGAMARNITTTLLSWDTGEKELVRPTLRVGTSYQIDLPQLNSYFIPNIDLVLRAESTPNVSSDNNTLFHSGFFEGALGGEFVFRDALFIRGGVDELQRATFGMGVKIPHLNIDYSFTSYDKELGNSHRVGVIIDFRH